MVTSNRYSLSTIHYQPVECGSAKSQNTLLKVQTVNYIDYINLTTIKAIKSFMDKIYTNSSIIESFSNGTDYLVMGNWSNNKLYSLYLIPLINNFI